MEPTTALAKAPSRKVFAPYFKGRWQNAQNIINDSVYINLIPPGYKTYYQAFIQQWEQWSRGFVPALHKQDFFSTGMGYTVCDVMTRQLMSGGYRLHSNDPKTKAFIEQWHKDDLNNIFNKMFFFANSVGNAILILTPVDGELYASVLPTNRVVFQIGRTGRITQAMLLNRFIAGNSVYYTREIRIEHNGVPYYKVDIAEGTLATSPTWNGVSMPTVPPHIESQWKYCYGSIKPATWYRMPERMRGIGCYNVKNKSVAVAIADLPGYSDSTLHTALDVLYSIDYNYTMAQMDQYVGKSTVLIPKQMQSRMVMGTPGTLTQGMTFREALDVQSPELDKTFYTEVTDGNLDGKTIQPTFIQPNLRGQERKLIRDADLELLASKVGLNASTLASHLAGSTGAKTDDEINAENSTDEKTIGNKRALASTAINAMLSDVAYFYGYNEDVDIQWGRATANSLRENEQLMTEYQNGTLSLEDYLRKRWSDLSEEDIIKKAEELKRIEKEKQEPIFDDKDYFGGEVNDESGEQTSQSTGNSDRGSGNRDTEDSQK